jgi:hypothetical protein
VELDTLQLGFTQDGRQVARQDSGQSPNTFFHPMAFRVCGPGNSFSLLVLRLPVYFYSVQQLERISGQQT